ncbi:DNA repair protein RAD51 homolog 4-like [Physeter macrocephalus]|uniref:DNA repair protein RAD51 homolog 4-like n=1 Tax=Physeter macrocephalus TaxID=9755 RepID=A0A455AXZ7_PHYMC|nr:DNA repair protein RAD51 homolog 4-like [Physeter catodon]|eukprot:XP_028340758.1 DNA repair protein RAD51 homolog 4-like [Physeter catodon]
MGVLRAGLCPGLTQDMVQLLRSRGIKTVVDLVSADLEEVAQKCGLSYKALVALRRVLLAQFSAFPFNGADLYEELKTSTAILSTGIASHCASSGVNKAQSLPQGALGQKLLLCKRMKRQAIEWGKYLQSVYSTKDLHLDYIKNS